MEAQLNECRWLYKELLSQRELCYEELGISLSKYEQSMLLPLMKEERPSLDQLHSKVLQNVVDRYIKKMIEGPTFAKSIADASWNQF